MFESMPLAPDDPILGLSEIYKSDLRKNKINLGIGVYVNEFGNAPILKSVKKAEELLLNNETSKNYLNIEGALEFNNTTQELLFNTNSNYSIISKNRVRTVQAPGGTGALRIIADCIAKNSSFKRKVWISNPSWVNHKNIFLAAGFEVCTYPYYDKITHSIDFDQFLFTINQIKSKDIVLLHGCCHNPTGIDPDFDQWNILLESAEKNGWIPLFDLAYQGFDRNLKLDLTSLHLFCQNLPELIVCNSYSKNFGLYNERIGACTIIADNNKHADQAFSQLKSVIRANYSNPPVHGASIVSTILKNQELRAIWENELNIMREHIQNMRKLFFYNLQNRNKINDYQNLKNNFDFIQNQKGMFSFMGFSEDQVIKLRKKSGIYLVDSGRLNLAGLSHKNIEHVCKAIHDIAV